ncbi:MAG TPA: glycosyltransferase family 9 protein, partial [Pseudolabrys sp.]|nr:glycosyltransferase family 9 protein [Pseudolabrys sp.]
MTRLELPEKPRILVVTLRRLGDVLLATPLIRSLRRAFPQARIEALVFTDTAGILAGNPDLDRIVTIPAQPSAAATLMLGARLFRRFDLAISTQSGDRPTGFAIAAGRARIAAVPDNANGRVKRALLTRSVPVTPGLHRVEEMLRLADALGIARVPELVCPRGAGVEAPDEPFAVIHAAPMFHYKQWTMQGWRDVAAALAARGLRVIATGGPAEAERRYLDMVW